MAIRPLGILYEHPEWFAPLFAELDRRGVDWTRIEDPAIVLRLDRPLQGFDVILERSINHTRALHALRIFNEWGIPTVNTYAVAEVCGNKLLTSTALVRDGVPTPQTAVAFTPESALAAIEQLGYPVILKPPVGSWGRLLAKVNDRDAAEAVLSHKGQLGSFHHSIFYIQEYIEKPGRDIRAFVVGDRVVAASYRNAEHWITNTARGATSTHCPVTPDIEGLALKAAGAVGGEVMGVDLIETKDGLKVIEINVGAEFHGLLATTDRDIAGEIVDYLVRKWERLQAGERPAPATMLIDGVPQGAPGRASAGTPAPRALG